MDAKMLEEFRRATGLDGSRYPEYRHQLDEKKLDPKNVDLKAMVTQFDHDYGDLKAGMQRVNALGGPWTDQERSAILRLRADLDAIEKVIKSGTKE